jgi:O-antigen/teichoic acid export membrane protein
MEPGTMTAVARKPSLSGRALKSSGITVLGFGMAQVIRLASNLVLTRILFPEAFGTMALVTLFLIAMNMLSDLGTGAAIMRSPRGDDPDFLDTAWVIQIVRGFVLMAVAAALAWPYAWWFGEPALAYYLPVAALALIVQGFNPTRFHTANRHMQAGRITVIDLAAQVVGIVAAIGLSWAWQSVWALVVSGLVQVVATWVLLNAFLPGHRNRFRWDREAAGELIHFGKWIFLSTVAGFIAIQADKIVMGGHLSLGDFGLYNIGYFLASFPLILSGVVMSRLLIPLYRESPPTASEQNRRRVRRLRFITTGGLTVLVAVLGFAGPWLVGIMYDPRYHAAAGVTVVAAVVQMPAIIIQSCDQAALAAGDSRRFFVLTLARGLAMVVGLVAGLQLAGVEGALIGQALAGLVVYPVLVWAVRPHGAWDPLHDGVFLALGLVIGVVVWETHAAEIAALAAFGP